MNSIRCFVLASGLLVATSGQAAAQQPATPAPAPAQKDDAVERARTYYERGLQLFQEENYDAALFEFERAYELAPSFKILYNMGRIQRQQNNYAAALRSYGRYLREGGAAVPADRRAEVEKDMAILKPRTAELSVQVNVDDADVYADATPVCTPTIEPACVGRSPLKAPIGVNGGRHKITASKKGYVAATSLISVVGSDKIEIKLELVSLEKKEAPKNPWVLPTFIGWGATGAAVIGAGIFGGLALHAKSQQNDLLGQFDSGPNAASKLSDARDKTQTLSHVSDALWITTGVLAVSSVYFTYRMIGRNKQNKNAAPTTGRIEPKTTLDLGMSATSLTAVGTF